jgi:hypothetical protein
VNLLLAQDQTNHHKHAADCPQLSHPALGARDGRGPQAH